ncbi:MAG: hypothetical protein KDK38_13405, partial [Leptospiraceae bacterium]|nr:hypothetical protein [Leptospiraceae bacterium]
FRAKRAGKHPCFQEYLQNFQFFRDSLVVCNNLAERVDRILLVCVANFVKPSLTTLELEGNQCKK